MNEIREPNHTDDPPLIIIARNFVPLQRFVNRLLFEGASPADIKTLAVMVTSIGLDIQEALNGFTNEPILVYKCEEEPITPTITTKADAVQFLKE